MQPTHKPPGYWQQFIPALTDAGNRAAGGLMAVGRALKPDGMTGTDLAYRGAAAALGGPVDLITMALRPMGYSTPDKQVVGGSEWIGQQLENVGLVGEGRAPIQEALTSMLSPSAAAKNMAMAGPALASIFIGKNAKTWNSAAAALAEQLGKEGATARQIWAETGTWRGPDGQWRQEIDDSQAMFNTYMRDGQKVEGDLTVGHAGASLGPTVGGILEHEPLRQAYGDGLTSRTFVVNSSPMSGGVLGSFNPTTESIVLYAPAKAHDARSTTLHELQHAIQKREGFAQGGNPMSAANLAAQELFDKRARMSRIQDRPEFMEAYVLKENLDRALRERKISAQEFFDRLTNHPGYKDYSEWERLNWFVNNVPENSFEAYRRLAGEAEARAVQRRMNLSPRSRRETFPEESYDVLMDALLGTENR